MDTISLLFGIVVMLVIIAIAISRYNGSSRSARQFLLVMLIGLFTGFVCGLLAKGLLERETQSDKTTQVVSIDSQINNAENLLSVDIESKKSLETPVLLTEINTIQNSNLQTSVRKVLYLDDS